MPGSGESFGIHTPFLGGVDGSHATGMGILGSEYQWAHLEWCRPRISLSQLKRKGGNGSSRASFANEEGITSGMGYTRAATEFQVINNPCLYQGHRHLLGTPGHQRLPAVKWSSIIPRLYQVINIPSFIPGYWRFLVYTREKRAIHTSVRGVGSASSAYTLQRSDSWAVCVCGTWASAIHACGTILGSEFPPIVQAPRCPQW